MKKVVLSLLSIFAIGGVITSNFFINNKAEVHAEGTMISNDIVSMTTHGSGNDVGLDFHMEQFDWPTTITNFDCRNAHGDANYQTNYNTKSKIHVYNQSNQEMAYTNEVFINVWGMDNVFSIRINNASTLLSSLSYVVIESGCEFPTYAGLYTDSSISKVSDGSRYVTTKVKKFAFDYNNKTFSETSIFNEIETEVISLKEANPKERCSFLNFGLSASDYGTLNTQNVKTNLESLYALNYPDYITINGKKLREYNIFNSSEKFLNLFSSSMGYNSFSVRSDGNNTGCYYIANNIRYETSDLTKYEVCIAKGCQFPSYSYISGTSGPTCYKTTKDVRFAYIDGEYVLEDNSFIEPTLEDNLISYVGIAKTSSASDKAIVFSLNHTDWPTSASFADKDIHNIVPCRDIKSHFVAYDVNNQIVAVSESEMFVNVWGSGSVTPAFGIRTPNNDQTTFKYVKFYKGMMIPTYSHYLNKDNNWYRLSKDMTFYSSKDGSFYLGSDLSSLDFANLFINETNKICSNYDGVSSNKDTLVNKFYAFNNIYELELSSNVIDELKTTNSETMIAFRNRYDFLVGKYNLPNFLSRDINTSSSIVTRITTDESMIILLAMIIPLTIIPLALVIKKRKEDK